MSHKYIKYILTKFNFVSDCPVCITMIFKGHHDTKESVTLVKVIFIAFIQKQYLNGLHGVHIMKQYEWMKMTISRAPSVG